MSATDALPRREGSRDGRGCLVCGAALASARAHYCSRAHQQRAFRLRHVQPTVLDEQRLRAELRRRGALVAHTVYECSVCGERLVGERRCPDCNLFGRAVGLGGRCAECDQPILLADLFELEVMP
jgi:hypothetical protein